LAEVLGRDRVLYDRFHEAEFARPNLDLYLQKLYQEASELDVVFLCEHYESKEWCGLEWRAIRDRIKQQRGDVMLLRLDDAPVSGVYSIDGYLDISDRPDAEVATLVLKRLAQNATPLGFNPPVSAPESITDVEAGSDRGAAPPGLAQNGDIWRRITDQQEVVEVPFRREGRRWFIDRYAVSCVQYCGFLNALTETGQVCEKRDDGIMAAYAGPQKLASDAVDFWSAKRRVHQPWFCSGEPWGFRYGASGWEPLPQCADLPATLVTWFGADWYSRWAQFPVEFYTKLPGVCLPPESIWEASAASRSGSQIVNHAGYWAGQVVESWADLRDRWLPNSDLHRRTRPLPVDMMGDSSSSCGAVQMLGNVWEWCGSPVENEAHAVLKGGCCYSPREQCTPHARLLVPMSRDDPYIGFRCGAFWEER
jgi:formylglycine-generating enzyme required for sulfatase activity